MTFGKVTAGDFSLPKSVLIDSNTRAVILSDVGNISFVGNKTSDWVSYVYKKTTRIKLLNKNAFDIRNALSLATLRILLHGSGRTADQLDDLQAMTYTLENGQVISAKLDPKDIFRDTLTRNRVEAKFTFPGLQEGCIIEYTYTLTSHRYWDLPLWEFQHQAYPCLYSKLEIAIPQMLGYITLQHGRDPYLVNKVEETKETYYMASVDVKAKVKKHTWVMKDIPAFLEEAFLDHPYNYQDMLEFNLLQLYDGDDLSGSTNWSSATKELLESTSFGAAIIPENTSNIQNTVDKIVTPGADITRAAREIYTHIRDNFTCVPDNDIYLGDDLYGINKRKKGGVEDINLLLVAMLRQKRINASPVILTTTEYGINPSQYPVLSRMNYVVCMIKQAMDTVFLDASQPLLGFGQLPLSCYNGHARIISDHDSGSVFFNRDNIREQHSTTVFIVNDEKNKGQMSGSVEMNPGSFESYDIRNEIKTIGEKEYLKKIQREFGPEIAVENMGIDSIFKFEYPVKVHYDFSFRPENNPDLFYYTPVIESSFKENPFKAEDRKYPVEMTYPLDQLYILNMEIPAGYAVEEIPKSVKAAFNGNDGFFEYLIQKTETQVQLKVHVKLNKATFAAEDYGPLRDFFNYVIKKETEPLVFKKNP